MIEILKNPDSILICSLAGSLIVSMAALIAGIAYRGRQEERYSPLNHYISELGEEGISRLAWVFNLGLMLCGLCLLPACISLGVLLPGLLSKLGMAAGIITAISVSLVGVFPMNKMKGHVLAASTYFRAGLVMVLCFTMAIAFQKEPLLLPRLFSLAGVPAILGYGIFLVLMQRNYTSPEDALGMLEVVRPKIWWMACAEWVVFLTSVPFFLVIGLGL